MYALPSLQRRERSASRARPAAIALWILSGLALLAGGCAYGGFGAGPAELLEQAQLELGQRELEKAYYSAKRIRTRYPDSDEGDEAFRVAATSFRRLYRYYRYQEPDSVWLNSEKTFVFEWLASYAEDGTLGEKANLFLRNAPWRLFLMFQEFAESHPVLAHWDIQGEKDNGLVYDVRSQPKTARAD